LGKEAARNGKSFVVPWPETHSDKGVRRKGRGVTEERN